MYLVETKNPRGLVAREIWATELAAELRRLFINATNDDYTGAFITELPVYDLKSFETEAFVLKHHFKLPFQETFIYQMGEYEIEVRGEKITFVDGVTKIELNCKKWVIEQLNDLEKDLSITTTL